VTGRSTPLPVVPTLTLAEALAQRCARGAWPDGAVRRVRDLLVVDVGTALLVVACDANAAIGSKPADHLRQDPALTGYSAAKVPLMEVLAAGATPLIVVDNLCCELEPTGRGILAGIAEALAQLPGGGVVVTGSDETNMPTVQTGVGVTVLGVARHGELLLGRAQRGDAVACVGTPKDGVTRPYREGDADVASIRHVEAARSSGLVHELLPVGSRGAGYEAGELAATAGLELEVDALPPVDLELSAGASTCFLAAAPPERLEALRAVVGLPVERIGLLR